MAIHASCGLAMLLGLASPVFAEDCRLALVLALDISSSVNSYEDRLQREGIAQALLAPEVVRSFLTGEPVALYVFEWSGPFHQLVLSPDWQIIESEDDLLRIAAAIASSTGGSARSDQTTAVGAALAYAATALKGSPTCWAQTVDIAGDGESNQGVEPRVVYRSHLLDGVTVNALVVGGALDDRGQPANYGDLVAWFDAEVLHGPGSFWILADGYEDYERAMRIKLLRELEQPMVSGSLLSEPRG